MKLRLLTAVGVLVATAMSGSASVTINLGAGQLFQSDGTTAIPAGSLIQLVASTADSTFTAPSPTSFTGSSADDVVLASFGTPDSTGFFTEPITFNLSGSLDAGDPLLLRWWPTLTTSSSAPGGGTPFGQFRTDATENFSDTGWFVPADGSTITLNFLDSSAEGSEPNSAGTASFTVVPEPASTLLFFIGGVATAARAWRKRRNLI